MSPRLDAHAHFFFPGFVGQLPENCRRQSPDEITLYQAHAQRHEIEQVLAVGYEEEPWAHGNNAYLASLAARYPWLRPVAYVGDPTQLTVAQLSSWQAQHFVGISLYVFNDEAAQALSHVNDEVWQWLAEQAWLISVNSRGDLWAAWKPILDRHPEVRLLIAHLGLPPALATAPDLDVARATLAPVLRLAAFPNVHVKFSGFYGISQPDYAFPHSTAWPYAQVVAEAYGTTRLIWGSDFSPALEAVSFPQTVEVLNAMPWLTAHDLTAIYYDNLARLFTAIEERKVQQ
jgi:L-fuconolactonase